MASACRASLRRLGAPVPQRRAGIESVPAVLRAAGVTVREYDVYRLMVERLSNKTIAARLQISPRTVEKHIASLLTKTALLHRDALSQHARDLLASGPAQPMSAGADIAAGWGVRYTPAQLVHS